MSSVNALHSTCGGQNNLWQLMTWRYWKKIRPSHSGAGLPLMDLVACSFLINVLGLVLPIMMLQIYDRILPNEGTSTLSFLILGVCIAIGFDCLLRLSRSYLTAWAGAVHDHALSTAMMEKLLSTSNVRFYGRSMAERFMQLHASSKLRAFYSGQSFLTLLDIPFAIIFITAIAFIGGGLVVVPLCAILLITLIGWRGARVSMQYSHEEHEQEKERINVVAQTLKNIHSVKGQAMENLLLRVYENNKAAQGKSHYLAGQSLMKTSIYTQAVSSLSLITIAGFGAIFAMEGALSIGGVAACVLLCGRAVQPIQRFVSMFERMSGMEHALGMVNEVLCYPELKRTSMPMPTGAETVGALNIEKMSFQYSKTGLSLLENINLKIQPGETIAIQGDTGSGKTTLLSLMMGLYKPTQGKVTLDGYLAHRIDHNTMTPGIAYLPQTPDIVHGTILENITMFRTDTHRKQARHVAQLLGLDDAVSRLPQGYNTIIGKGQVGALADGMLKRVAIARALLEPARVILFDEADAGLDAEGRSRLFKLMKDLSGKCTLIMVSKNPSIFQLTNRCYQIKEGRLRSFRRRSILAAQNLTETSDGQPQDEYRGEGL